MTIPVELHVGDQVEWAPEWAHLGPASRIVGIEHEGRQVESVGPGVDLDRDEVFVDLEGGRWAYPHQLRRRDG